MYVRCAVRPSRGGYSVSVLCPDFVRFSLRLDGACAARDWNGTSEFPRACYRMLHPAAPTGLSSSIIRTRGRSASDSRANVEPRNELCHATDVPTDAKIRLIGRECRRFISFPGAICPREIFFVFVLSTTVEREREF